MDDTASLITVIVTSVAGVVGLAIKAYVEIRRMESAARRHAQLPDPESDPEWDATDPNPVAGRTRTMPVFLPRDMAHHEIDTDGNCRTCHPLTSATKKET